MARARQIPLHEALDRIAAEEGFTQWSLLAARAGEATTARGIFNACAPGDMLLLAARPSQGKTPMSAEILSIGMQAGHVGAFFTLDYTARDVGRLFKDSERPEIHTSDAISADFMVQRLATAKEGTVVVVDYLQLLDQQRHKPSLAEQVRTLKTLAHDKRLILIVLSPIDRSYDPAIQPCPDLRNVRLPNPAHLSLFNKTCFLQGGAVRFHAGSKP